MITRRMTKYGMCSIKRDNDPQFVILIFDEPVALSNNPYSIVVKTWLVNKAALKEIYNGASR